MKKPVINTAPSKHKKKEPTQSSTVKALYEKLSKVDDEIKPFKKKRSDIIRAIKALEKIGL